MMRTLILAVALFPLAAQAQTPPATFAVPTPAFQHVVQFLQAGGTHAEGQALAEQLIALAQAQMAAQKAPEAPAR
jgi:hypothetical protein